MKKIYFLLLVGMISSTVQAQQGCENFRTGNFRVVENGILKAKVQRNDSLQFEQHQEKEIKLRILWIDDCTYRLVFLEGNEAFWNSRPKDLPTPDLIVKITEVHGNKYLQESKFDFEDDFVYKSEMVKVE